MGTRLSVLLMSYIHKRAPSSPAVIGMLKGIRTWSLSGAGNILLHGGVQIDVLSAAPARNFIAPNAPNPFNPSTTLSYGLAQGGPVKLRVFDGRDRLVRTLEQLPYLAPGFYTVTWNGLDNSGRAVASGVYHARLELGGHVLTRRLTLLK